MFTWSRTWLISLWNYILKTDGAFWVFVFLDREAPPPWLTDLVWQGVTYCGESSASSLTMANVPWHQEVVAFVQQLAAMLPEYEIACEHEHSNCLLIAHEKVRGAASASKGTKSDFCWKDKESQT